PRRDLPPFPTRRSSDLSLYEVPDALVRAHSVDLFPIFRRENVRDMHVWLLSFGYALQAGRLLRQRRPASGGYFPNIAPKQDDFRDRKSTRLNSSHVKIS